MVKEMNLYYLTYRRRKKFHKGFCPGGFVLFFFFVGGLVKLKIAMTAKVTTATRWYS